MNSNSGDTPGGDGPEFPEITVEIRRYGDKPMAVMAMVRRALQRAGEAAAAARFTTEALGSDPDSVLAIAERYVRVE
jgi:hypothetical protein